MASRTANRVREVTVTTGTGALALGGAVSSLYRAVSAAFTNGQQLYYCVEDLANGAWEVGLGTYTSSGNTLSRDTVYDSSNAGALVNLAGGTKQVFVTQPGGAMTDQLGNGAVASIVFVLDGGGAALTTGVKGDLRVPFDCTIVSSTLLADQSGSIVVDIWKDTYANYPPTVADTITASAKPTISATTKAEDTTLTGWTKAIAAGDTLRFNIDSVTTCQRVTLVLKVAKGA